MRISLLGIFFIAGAFAQNSVPGPSQAELKQFHTLHEGADLLPVWLLKELAVKGKPFLSPENLSQYGLIEDKSLPLGMIGLSQERGMLGINCAACHVNQLQYTDPKTKVLFKTEVLNGAPSLFNVERFTEDISTALEKALFSTKLIDIIQKAIKPQAPGLFEWFWPSTWYPNLSAREEFERLYGTGLQKTPVSKADYHSCDQTHATLAGPLKQDKSERMKSWDIKGQTNGVPYLTYLTERIKYVLAVQQIKRTQRRVEFGPGRVDDFGGARDVLWPDSAVQLVGPSSFLDLWNFQQKNKIWVHWDLNMNSTFDRNLGQAITGGALYQKDLVTANAKNIGDLQTIAGKLSAPKWPENWLAIKDDLAGKGSKVFETYCSSCHNDMQKLIPLKDVGTDPNRATVYAYPMQDGCSFIDVAQREMLAIKNTVFGAPINSNTNRAEIDPMGGQAKWRATYAYVARSLRGIWASPPYLHNGSVLTLREVLDSTARKDRFRLDPVNREYDPVNVGYQYIPCKAGETGCFDTREPGNSNAGHTYGDTLSVEERAQVIEYLKTLH